MLILPRSIQAPCLLRRGMPTIFLHLGKFQPAKWGIFNRRKLGNIQPALTHTIHGDNSQDAHRAYTYRCHNPKRNGARRLRAHCLLRG